MKKFEGNINGKIYTDEKEFDKALSTLERTDDMFVSYKYVSVSDVSDDIKLLENANSSKTAIDCNKNYVAESQYVKSINNKKDVELDDELVNKLKLATNKSDIKHNVCKKIVDFDNKINANLLNINEMKSDYAKLEEKMKLINNQIQTLDNANNNYYLNKEYYTNIKNLLDTPVDIPEEKKECDCGCNCNGNSCTCGNQDEKKSETISLKDVYNMSPYDLARYLNKRKIFTLSDLVEYFLKNY
jgi:hypothetical protein